MTHPYYEMPGFGDVYLEDSWVLGVEVAPRTVDFSVSVVLRESHPRYSPPPPDKQYCYRPGQVRFGGVRRVTWDMTGIYVGTDPDGSIDYGNFDRFVVDKDRYTLVGDFGAMEIEADSCELTLEP